MLFSCGIFAGHVGSQKPKASMQHYSWGDSKWSAFVILQRDEFLHDSRQIVNISSMNDVVQDSKFSPHATCICTYCSWRFWQLNLVLHVQSCILRSINTGMLVFNETTWMKLYLPWIPGHGSACWWQIHCCFLHRSVCSSCYTSEVRPCVWCAPFWKYCEVIVIIHTVAYIPKFYLIYLDQGNLHLVKSKIKWHF